MPKYRRLTTEERLRAVFLAETGASLRKIARELKATPMGIKKIIKISKLVQQLIRGDLEDQRKQLHTLTEC